MLFARSHPVVSQPRTLRRNRACDDFVPNLRQFSSEPSFVFVSQGLHLLQEGGGRLLRFQTEKISHRAHKRHLLHLLRHFTVSIAVHTCDDNRVQLEKKNGDLGIFRHHKHGADRFNFYRSLEELVEI